MFLQFFYKVLFTFISSFFTVYNSFKGVVGAAWIVGCRNSMPDVVPSGSCLVDLPNVRSLLDRFSPGSVMMTTFDTRLVRLGIGGRIMHLGFSDVDVLRAAVEYFVQIRSHLLNVCADVRGVKLLRHSNFCSSGHLYPRCNEGREVACVPIMRIDFSFLSMGASEDGVSVWGKNDRILSLMFTDAISTANMV